MPRYFVCSPFRAVGYFLSPCVILLNGASLVLLARSMRQSRRKDIDGQLFLHVADFIIGPVVITLLVYDQGYDHDFSLNRIEWLQSVSCQLIGFASDLSISTSLASIMAIALKSYLIVKYPFKAEKYLEKAVVYFYSYWIVALFMSIWRMIWAIPQDALCMFNFKTNHDILGSALIIISLFMTHLAILVCVIILAA